MPSEHQSKLRRKKSKTDGAGSGDRGFRQYPRTHDPAPKFRHRSSANGERANEPSEILRLTKNIHVVIDSEIESAESKLSEARQKFLENCRKLGIRATATLRRAMENYLTDFAVKTVFGISYRTLTDFEKLASAAGWAKAATWKAAREMSRDDLLATDVGKFLDGISENT